MEMPDRYKEQLHCHNQFVLGPSFIEDFRSWKKIMITDRIRVTVHPDLSTYQAFRENKSITLLGFVLDPHNPQTGDPEIITGLLHALSDCDAFFQETYRYGGRWILIVNDGREIKLFNDAAGLRQVFYSDRRCTDEFWCASQPRMIADILRLEMAEDAIDFINSYEFRKNPEFRWPGDSSPYKEIRHMLPNHYLDLATRCCKRYWPDRPLPYLPLSQAVGKASATLQGLMKSAGNRFDLALSMTAGLDSRMVLAASKDISNTVSLMTVRQIGKPENHADVGIPSALLSKLGLKHDVVKSSFIMTDEFLTAFRKNVPIAHPLYAPDAQAILDYYGQMKVAVTGSASEIARSSFRRDLNKPKNDVVTPQDLAKLQIMGENSFALHHFQRWLSGTGEIYNLDILDLFEWEQGHGNWLAMCQTEFDIAWKDIFTPFNCRNLLITMLSVDEQYRRPPYELHEKIISKLWPELLSVPINPHYQKNEEAGPGIISFVRTQVSRYLPHAAKESIKKILRIR